MSADSVITRLVTEILSEYGCLVNSDFQKYIVIEATYHLIYILLISETFSEYGRLARQSAEGLTRCFILSCSSVVKA